MRILTLACLAFAATLAKAQTTLYSESFEGASTFTLNTTDAGSTISTWNTWVINNSYTGGDGDLVCFGFPFTYTIVNTPAQPVGITNPDGNYLHTASVEGITDGITCCSFGAADGLCISADNTFSRMTNDVSTIGSADVNFNFWWLCEGGDSYYGQVYYSTNGGVNWTATATPSQYNFQGSWTQQSITLPAFGNQATLRFGFRFVNAVGSGALDPGFGIDDVSIVAAAVVPNSITTGALGGTTFCQGAAIQVPYTAQGTYSAGNIFSAELSDAVGSFAAPTVIGTLASTNSGSISCIIPALTPVGAGYKVRVVSDQPVTVGTPSGVDIAVVAAPFAGDDDLVTICKNTGIYDLMQFIPGASACGAWTAPGGGSFSGSFNSSTNNAGDYTYTTNCPGGCPQDDATISISLQDPANAGNDVGASLCSNGSPVSLISYVDGGDLTGIFFYNGSPTSGTFLDTPGVYDLEYVVYGTAPCVNDTADFTFTVNAAPDAGANASITICTTDPPVDLMTLLAGTPQSGGVWTGPSGNTVSNIIDPATSPSGLYTYTVNGIAPCIDDQAFVALVVDPCSGIEEAASISNGIIWMGQQGDDHVFRLSTAINSLEVIDASGRVVAKANGPFAAGSVRVPLGDLASGMHVVRARGAAEGLVRIVHRAQ